MLLDFGAARTVQPETRRGYHRLLTAGLEGRRDAVREAAVGAGFLGAAADERHRASIDRMIDIVLAAFDTGDAFDFADRSFVPLLRGEVMGIAEDKHAWHLPPVDTLFVQRKVSGTALLCARLKARVDIRAMIEAYRDADLPSA